MKAFIWIVDWKDKKRPRVTGDLFFSSKEKFRDCLPWIDVDKEQLVEVEIPDGYLDIDFVPDNY